MWLLDHPNASGPNYYDNRRRCQHGIDGPHVIVLHTAENLPDFTPPDTGAENVARYATNTTRDVSWHSTVDSDSIIPMLPDDYTAWHASSYNRCSLGIEMATQAHKWVDTDYDWRVKILRNCAAVVREWSQKHGIPLVLLTKSEVDQGKYGVTFHSRLDPSRRSDPGTAFPVNFMLREAGATTPQPPAPQPEPSGTPVMGEAEVSLGQALGFVTSRAANADYPIDTVRKIVETTWTVAEHDGVRADLALALMCKETGFFGYGGTAQADQWNFGGIGTTGPGVPGRAFPTLEAGVKAVVRRMRMYAVDDPVFYDESILVRPLPRTNTPSNPRGFKGWGKHPNIEDFGGAWADPGHGYGESIVRMVELMKQVPTTPEPSHPFSDSEIAWLDARYVRR